MNLIVRKDNEKLSLERAITLGILKISGNTLMLIDDNYVLCQSTNLFDINGIEIFVNDILVDKATGILYKVVQFYATIYIQQLGTNKHCILETLTNFKLGNTVDFVVNP